MLCALDYILWIAEYSTRPQMITFILGKKKKTFNFNLSLLRGANVSLNIFFFIGLIVVAVAAGINETFTENKGNKRQ